MAITVQNLKDRLQPYLIHHLPDDVLDILTDDDFVRVFNQVARDLNSAASIRVERFYKKANTTNAADSDLTNYLVQGVIQKVYSLKYIDDDWEGQEYTYTQDRLIFKSAVPEDTQIDMRYLRETEDVTDTAADEIDLPDVVVDDYEQLIKKKFRVDYGDLKDFDYETALQYWAGKVVDKLDYKALSGQDVRGSWMHQTGDGFIYQIEDHYIGLENFTADASGNYFHVDED